MNEVIYYLTSVRFSTQSIEQKLEIKRLGGPHRWFNQWSSLVSNWLLYCLWRWNGCGILCVVALYIKFFVFIVVTFYCCLLFVLFLLFRSWVFDMSSWTLPIWWRYWYDNICRQIGTVCVMIALFSCNFVVKGAVVHSLTWYWLVIA